MTIQERFIQLIVAVNDSTTEQEHRENEIRLQTFKETVKLFGYRLNLMAADMHYLDKGVNRPMCCGVWLDWKPTEVRSILQGVLSELNRWEGK